MFTAEEIQSLNELELSLYNYITSNKEKVVYMRIRDLAAEAHVSTTTILRFCKKMHCIGFAEFKVKLRMYIQEQKPVKLYDDKSIILDFLDRTQSKSFQSDINRACKIIHASTNIIFVGIGSSGILASYAARYFSSLDKFAVCIDDPFYPIIGKNLDDSVAVVFSVSGETIDTLRQANMLKTKRCKMISITNSKHCTLARMADQSIAYYVQQQRNSGSDVTTQMPVLCIIETMARKVHDMAINDPF